MPDRFYTTMSRHVLRYYCKNTDKPSRDKTTWYAAQRVLQRLPEAQRGHVVDIYRDGKPVPAAIRDLASQGVPEQMLWTLVNKVDRMIAKEMGWI